MSRVTIFNSDYGFPNGHGRERVAWQAEPWIVHQTNIGWKRFTTFAKAVQFIRAGAWS